MSGEIETSRAETQRAVDDIVASGVLGSSERRADLLRYLVETELSGNGDRIKAVSIAMDVLGRDASFDPNTDSIVRSEIGRLRDALRLYHAEYADPSALRIEIPKGSYRPVFSVPEEPVRQTGAKWRLPALLVSITAVLFAATFFLAQSFKAPSNTSGVDPATNGSGLPYEVVKIAVTIPEVHGNNPIGQKAAIGLSSELIMDLSAYPWLSIIAPVDGFDAIEPHEVDYVLDGEMFWGDGVLETQTKLVTYPEQEIVWSSAETIELAPSALRDAIVGVASAIAFELASGRGIAPELTKKKNARNSPENLEAYLCYLGLHEYSAGPTAARHLALRDCLLRAVDSFPEFGDAWAGLALVYIDEARFRSNARAGADPWQDASMAVDQALKYAPLRMPSLNVALINSIESPQPDVDQFEHISGLLLSLFPKHPMTLYNVGSRAAEFLGRWEEGMALIEDAIELSPDPPGSFFLTHAYKTAMGGSDAEALASVEPLDSETAVSQLLLKYLAVRRNSLPESIETYSALLGEQGLSDNDALIMHVKNRRYDAELEAALLDQLEDARSGTDTQ